MPAMLPCKNSAFPSWAKAGLAWLGAWRLLDEVGVLIEANCQVSGVNRVA